MYLRSTFNCFLIFAMAILIISIVGISINALLIEFIFLVLLLPLFKKNIDMFEPIIFANIALLFIFVVRPLADYVNNDFNHIGYDISATFTSALIYALLGSLTLQLGYFYNFLVGFKQPPPFRHRLLSDNGKRKVGLFFLFLGIILYTSFLFNNEFRCGMSNFECTITSILSGRSDEQNLFFLQSSAYLYNAPLFIGFSLLIFFSLIMKKSAHCIFDFIAFVGCLLLVLIFAGSQGNRSFLLPAFSSIYFYYYLSSNTRPNPLSIFFTAYIFIAISSFLLLTRNTYEKIDFISAMSKSISSPVERFCAMVSGGDSEMFDSFATELTVVPNEMGFHVGSSIYDIFIRATPRFLFTDKPLEVNDLIISNLWPEHYEVNRASSAFSIIGSLYSDSGVYAILIGMFVFGVLLSKVWKRCSYPNNFDFQLIYSLVPSFILILIRGNIPDTLGRIFFYFIPFTVMFFLAKK